MNYVVLSLIFCFLVLWSDHNLKSIDFYPQSQFPIWVDPWLFWFMWRQRSRWRDYMLWVHLWLTLRVFDSCVGRVRIIIVVSCVSGSVTVVSVLQCPSMIVGDQVIVDVSVVGWVIGVFGVLLVWGFESRLWMLPSGLVTSPSRGIHEYTGIP